MLKMQYHTAGDPESALRLLREAGSEAKVLSGGTNLLVYLRNGLIAPRLLVDISRIPQFKGLSAQDDGLRLQPNCTISDLLRSPQLSGGLRLLPLAAAWFAGPSVRNRATVAGNVADASPAADMTVPLLALDAEVEISALDRPARRVPIQDFVIGPRRTALAVEELITSLIIRRFPEGMVAYHKLARRDSLAISILSLAVLVELSGKICRRARIAVGAASPVPFRALEAEQALEGEPFDAPSISKAARLACHRAQPISDIRGSAGYRREMIEVLVKRMLQDLRHSGDLVPRQ